MKKPTTAEEKSRLREAMRRKRGALPPEERVRRSRRAAAHLLASTAWKRTETVFLYVAARGEMETDALFAAAREQGKRIGMPRCLDAPGRMVFAACEAPAHLAPGRFGLMEPLPDRQPIVDPGPALAVVPGAAFDLHGGRLGQGGGYYDRYFSAPAMRDVILTGYGYAFQVVPELPVEPWDLPMQMLCTEEGLVTVGDNHGLL